MHVAATDPALQKNFPFRAGALCSVPMHTFVCPGRIFSAGRTLVAL